MEQYDGGIWIESHPKEPLDQEQMFSHIKLGKKQKNPQVSKQTEERKEKRNKSFCAKPLIICIKSLPGKRTA